MKRSDPQLTSGQPIAEHAGFEGTIPCNRDPYEVLDDMMVVVEQLCPVWPQRELFSAEGIWRI